MRTAAQGTCSPGVLEERNALFDRFVEVEWQCPSCTHLSTVRACHQKPEVFTTSAWRNDVLNLSIK